MNRAPSKQRQRKPIVHDAGSRPGSDWVYPVVIGVILALGLLAVVVLTRCLCTTAGCCSIEKRIREVSVSIEADGHCIGSGTLYDRDGETWCLTAAHVVTARPGAQLRVVQHAAGGKEVSAIAAVVVQDDVVDMALLQVGRGLFPAGVTFHPYPTDQHLDEGVIHCGSMMGLHHTVTRGHVVGIDRQGIGNCKQVYDQLDLTGTFGSSGGGVFDHRGRLIGMVTRGSGQRIVFMVPIRHMSARIHG